MFVRVTHMGIRNGAWGEAMGLLRLSIIEALEAQPGFLRLMVTGDEAAGRMTVITMWQNAPPTDAVVPGLGALIAGEPESSAYPDLLDREF